MAPRKQKKPANKIKFQLTRNGIAGIAIVCFCIFLWMFILGVWAGQFLLYPPVSEVKPNSKLEDSEKGKQVLDVIQIEAKKKKKIIKN